MVKVDFGISKFAIVGMAGYIAPRHLDAIKNSECDLVAAHDVADSVGIMDRYFPHADFTTDADKFAGILKHGNIDYLTVCTPNYLHCRHSILGLRNGMNVICEKPLGLRSAISTPWLAWSVHPTAAYIPYCSYAYIPKSRDSDNMWTAHLQILHMMWN